MRKVHAAELLFVTVVLFLESGECLKCYVCRTDHHRGCGTWNKSLVQDCPQVNGSAYCRKIHQQLRFKDQNDFISIRECATSKGSKSCYKYKWVELAYQETCECDTEMCNRGSDVFPAVFLIVLTFFILKIAYLRIFDWRSGR